MQLKRQKSTKTLSFRQKRKGNSNEKKRELFLKYDSRVKEMRFYNYKLLPESVDLMSLEPFEKNKVWWLADQLTEQNGKYELDILLEICVPHQRQFHLKLRFDRAEVDRK